MMPSALSRSSTPVLKGWKRSCGVNRPVGRTDERGDFQTETAALSAILPLTFLCGFVLEIPAMTRFCFGQVCRWH